MKKKSLKSVLLAKAEGVEIGDREVDKFVFFAKKKKKKEFGIKPFSVTQNFSCIPYLTRSGSVSNSN